MSGNNERQYTRRSLCYRPLFDDSELLENCVAYTDNKDEVSCLACLEEMLRMGLITKRYYEMVVRKR